MQPANRAALVAASHPLGMDLLLRRVRTTESLGEDPHKACPNSVEEPEGGGEGVLKCRAFGGGSLLLLRRSALSLAETLRLAFSLVLHLELSLCGR